MIPGLRGSKASRAVILQRAVECIEELVKLNRDHTVCVETLKRQNDILDSRVSQCSCYISIAVWFWIYRVYFFHYCFGC